DGFGWDEAFAAGTVGAGPADDEVAGDDHHVGMFSIGALNDFAEFVEADERGTDVQVRERGDADRGGPMRDREGFGADDEAVKLNPEGVGGEAGDGEQ